ncbi:bifunctional 2-keto-4-hydroxyglutarate aldolase/2-keto-3-deoxy-6-phosphogluconate aldolase [Bacillus sp. AG4(2022)]|uniref:bifunctional 2-keto-4-hydroxyglutarate aldolase/2-keto-3-deoxy-6-phosphogluconate aldolase n=1 Tax=Bacillus sp. AG4(2022) TaxID=2962594 RepID=UPI0028812D2F|nr:bifunctional 2-keto-4-hydroxyglutarate aldolase/2-keto-3-deoxy-6-phosphogluconate aldolase [Bacillus sp. AG4(2022)]MDT0159178.1 bifunctional 2-keto-4-hydroxyglutarate aldolase/2-keto-3-deoxy-6-phosphogluconate aldolase [Bacillus sp. AG4(2022)]
MKKLNILNRLIESGVVAVVRADSSEEAVKISEACVKGGIAGIEITFTIDGAEAVLKELSGYFADDSSVVLGAGTVLDAATARIAILAGAEFIVSPAFDRETAKLCNLYQVPYMPGCMTITEMKAALEYGADIIKLFPGNAFGPDFIKSVKAPLPQANIMPTGGVSLENAGEWIRTAVWQLGLAGTWRRLPKQETMKKLPKCLQNI